MPKHAAIRNTRETLWFVVSTMPLAFLWPPV
jgi:hypothetical protein